MEIKVLDKGYVRLMGATPDADLMVANAARASFAKFSSVLTEAEVKLINFLARENHLSPFRHAIVTLEIKAPVVLVGRQWFKYRVGSTHTDDSAQVLGQPNGDDGGDDLMQGRNEMSRRYVTAEPEFHRPESWRAAPANKKQGSGGRMPEALSQEADRRFDDFMKVALANYDWAIENGFAPEQCRIFLPYVNMYTSWWWTASLDGVFHFLRQRLGHDAQSEIRSYAEAVLKIMRLVAPISTRAMVDEKLRSMQ